MCDLKTIVVEGVSSAGWEDAVRQVVRKASESIADIAAVDVLHQSARARAGEIVEYRATVRISFDMGEGFEPPPEEGPIAV